MIDSINKSHDSYNPGKCILCGSTLGSIRNLTKIPIFDPFESAEVAGLGGYIGQIVHRDCWYLWEKRDLIAKTVIDQNTQFSSATQFVKSDYVGAWGFLKESIDFSHGCISLPRSSLVFKNIMGYDVDSCDIRGRTVNIMSLLDIIKAGRLIPNAEIQQASIKEIPDMFIKCYDYIDDYLEVSIMSKNRMGMNYDCFIFKADIDLLKYLDCTK